MPPSLQLLGIAALQLPDGSRHVLERKDAGLCAYLALEGATPRGRLAALLWPKVDDEKARTNLRQRLARLRRLAPTLITEDHGVLRLEDKIAADAAASFVGEGRALLLETHTYDDCAEFAEWLESKRSDALARRSRDYAGRLAALRGSDPEAALQLALDWIAFDPRNEDAHRQLIELHYLRGDIGTARKAYDDCVAMLRRVYAAEPAEPTAWLGRQLQAATLPKTRAQSGSVPLSLLRPPRIVGRDAELRLATEAVERRATVVLVGDAGIGKSRLLDHLLDSAAGTRVRFRCRQSDALQPRRALARFLLAVQGVSRPPLDDDTARELARLLPDYGPPPEPMTSAAEVQRLHEAVARYLDVCHAAAGPLLLAFDDLQFADPASIDALKSCLRPDAAAKGGAPLFVLATRRLGGSWQAGDLLKWLEKFSEAEAIMLEALGSSATRQLISDLDLPTEGYLRMAETLHRHSGGNPAMLLETLRAMVSRTESAASSITGLPIPASLSEALDERMAGLSNTAAQLARLAAVSGQEFSSDLAQHTLAVPRIALAPALRELAGAQILRDDAFTHDLLGEAILDSLPAAEREHLHLQVASYLQDRACSAALVAHHLLAARDEASALPHLRKAEAEARQAQRPDECGRLLEEIAGIELRLGNRTAAAAALGECFAMYMGTSFIDDANRVFEQWSAVASTPVERLLLHAQRAKQQANFKYLDVAMEHANEAILIIESTPELPDEALAEAYVGVCPALAFTGGALRAAQLGEQLEPRLKGASAPARVAYLKGRGSALNGIGRTAEAVGLLQTVVALHESGVDTISEWDTRMRLASYLTAAGQAQDAVLAARRSIDAGSRQPHFPTMTSTAHFVLAGALLVLGEYREALSYVVARRDYFRRTGWRADGVTSTRLALLLLHLGKPEAALSELAELQRDRMGAVDEADAELVAAQVAQALGKDARPHLDRVEALAGQLPNRATLLRGTLLQTAARNPNEALQLAEDAVRQARERGWETLIRSASIVGAHSAVRARSAGRAQWFAELCEEYGERCDPLIGYGPEHWWAASRAWALVDRNDRAAASHARAREWVQRRLRDHVPDEFREAFFGQPINRAILAE